jgi:hypothetical protein
MAVRNYPCGRQDYALRPPPAGDLAKQLMAPHRPLGVLLGALPEERLDVIVTVGIFYVGVIGLSGCESVILDAD